MNIKLAGADLPTSGALVALAGPDGTLSTAADRLDERSSGLLRRALQASGQTIKHGQVIDLVLPAALDLDRLVLLVAGKPEGLTRLELEELGGTLAQKLAAARVTSAAVASAAGLQLGHEPPDVAAALALGAQLRSYRFTRYQHRDGEDEPARLDSLTFHLDDGAGPGEKALQRAAGLVAAVTRARDLVSEPANVLYPEAFAQDCRELAAFGVEVEVLDKDRLAELGMNALLAVGQGSARPPYVVVMRWQGAGSDAAPVALVGKGVCFDTGGISIKPAGGMEEMKWDMAGAAAVVGAMQAVATRKAKANVVGVIGLAENMPSGTAQRPGDVVRAMSGKTIEVINTDAEGRLLLADVIWYTKERFKPRAMVDLATLTGAVVVALGKEQAGLFASDDALAEQLRKAGEETGERLWRMPLGKAYEKHIKSDIADIKNVGRNREAGATAGAVFIQQFVGDVPWAHLDIAGMAWAGRDLPLAPKGATGFGVRLLDRLIEAGFER